jgi:hypothetical protein
MNSLKKNGSSVNPGFALVVVLAFIVLLTGLTIVYYSRTTSDRRVAHSSFNQSKVDQLVASAMETIVGDLRQEIINGSTATVLSNGTTNYTPSSAANMLPTRSPTPAAASTPAIVNLVRRSIRSDAIPAPALGSRASAVNSTSDPSANGRSITLARWNSHYLVPKSNRLDDKSDPVTTGFTAPRYWAPDWVFLTNQGATVIAAPNNAVIGRYAYAIYDEGGLVDLNVAGYPTGTSIYQYGRKGSLAFADLTAPSPYPVPNPNTDSPPTYQVDRLVGWRNYGTTQPTNTFPTSNPASQAFARNFQTSTAPAGYFYNFVVNNTTGFLSVRSDPTPTPTPWNYLNVTGDPSPSPYPWNGRTDQMFLSRQQLIAFRSATQFSANALEYLSSFSREAVAGAPQWSPTTPSATNPNFQTLLVTGSFTRNNGTSASVGDPLVNKRFLLERLNWLTYRGPSATAPGGSRNAVPISTPTAASPDWDLWLLTTRFGLTSKFLQDQTIGGTAANILKYFGLVWDTTNERWNYVGHAGGSLPLSSIATLGSLTGTRDPDFFELLQAGIILPTSVDDDNYSTDTTLLPVDHQRSKMLHILTIGANLIAQSRADSYPVRIACTVNGNIMEAIGAPRLPYLNSLAVCPVAGTSWTGGINWLLVPNLWDPFRDSWDLAQANVSSTLTPGYLRPSVRVSVSGGVSIGTVVNSPSINNGIVPSALVTPSPAPLTISPAQSVALSTPTATPGRGRNGFLQAARIDTTDCTPTPAPTPANISVSPTPAAQWNNVSYPSPTPNPTPLGSNVVFRISFPGSSIPSSWTTGTQNPVLILTPGFQMTVDYQSPNGTWYSYSFLQGNSSSPTANPAATPHNTWISGGISTNPNLNLTTTLSVYGRNPAPSPTPPPPAPTPTPFPTILLSSTGAATPWTLATLAQAPMFAKADPRSIRYNSQVGVLNVAAPPSSTPSAAGVVGSIWPAAYAAPPVLTIANSPTPAPSATPTPSGTPNANPAIYSQIGDNGAAGSNPYSEASPGTFAGGDPVRSVIMNRPFRSVGEMGYAFRDQPFKTLDFSSANSPDAALLDLFSVNDYGDPSSMRAGVISLNSHEPTALAAVLGSTIKREDTPRGGSPPAPTPQPLTATEANNIALSLASNTSPVTNKAGLTTLVANETGLGPTVPKTQRESIVRALGEVGQTRTWNLLIDVIAQSGNYPPGENNLANFVVQGEQRYWVHVAIDRFTGQVIDKQIEVVNE